MRKVSVTQFLNTDFRSFSTYDCVINIPNLVDGFKISQRKAIHVISPSNKKMTVERYSSDIAAKTHYHHGSMNIAGVIIGLTQDFTGSNNVNWLQGSGQFGNILSQSAASSRYISVEAHSNFNKWFKKEDQIILDYEFEDGEQIEPVYFIPIIPTILFNGSAGIGTGYASKILSYNPKDIIDNVKLAINNKALKPMTPYYKGFKGSVSKTENQTTFVGTFERVNTTTVKITSLPIGYDLDAYKNVLGKMIEREEIKEYDDNSTDTEWNILVYTTRSFLMQDDEVLLEKLKLISKESENITVWTEDKKIKCFETPEQLIQHFVKFRINKYNARRLKQLDLLNTDLDVINEKIRFINFYIKNSKWFSETKKPVIIERLEKEKFIRIDALMNIRVYNLQLDEIERLKNEVQKINQEIDVLSSKTAIQMYQEELKAL